LAIAAMMIVRPWWQHAEALPRWLRIHHYIIIFIDFYHVCEFW